MKRILAISLAANLALIACGSYCVHRKGGIAYLARVLNPPAVKGHYQDTKQSVYDALPISEWDSVVIGDSLADYGEWSELLGPEWKNRGVHGATTADLATKGVTVHSFIVTPESVWPPKRMLIIVGVNDIQAGVPLAETERFFKSATRPDQNPPRWFVPVLAANSRLYAQWIRPEHPDCIEPTPKRARDVNKFIPDDMKIDVSPLLQPDGQLRAEYTNDGLHLNGAGYKVLAGAIRKRISL